MQLDGFLEKISHMKKVPQAAITSPAKRISWSTSTVLDLLNETLFQISMIICPSVTAEEQEIVIYNYRLLKPYFKKIIFNWNRHIDKWNDLPASVVDLESVNSFKKALKKILFTN